MTDQLTNQPTNGHEEVALPIIGMRVERVAMHDEGHRIVGVMGLSKKSWKIEDTFITWLADMYNKQPQVQRIELGRCFESR